MIKETFLKNVVRSGAWGLANALLFFVFLSNLTPWGAEVIYSDQYDSRISLLAPKSRVVVKKEGQDFVQEQISDLTYFTTEMPFRFDNAVVRVTYLNPFNDQIVKLGFKDQDVWHYNTTVIDAPFLNNVPFPSEGSGPFLFQKNPRYDTAQKFLSDPPTQSVIGTFDYNLSYLKNYSAEIPDYAPKETPTIISIPLRGKHTFYVYLKDERFLLDITKQDLNWYDDEDVMRISVYKGNQVVYQATVEDDGVESASKKAGYAQEIHIENPGKDLPENGVYRVVVDATGDTVIKQIKTNLHKIVFEGSVSPIENREVFPGVVNQTRETRLTTRGEDVSIQSYHTAGLQELRYRDQSMLLDTVHVPLHISNDGELLEIVAPQSDIVAQTLGYFSFDHDQYFDPTPYKVYEVKSREDLERVDYLLTNYEQPFNEKNGWSVSEKEFDLRNAFIENGTLSWLIHMPGIQQRNEGIRIKKIEVEFRKKGWVQS